MSKIRDEIINRQDKAEKYLETKRTLWDDVEKLFHNQLTDNISSGTKSQVFDPKLTTLTLERGYRVMAQLHTGKVKGISSNDKASAALMNLIADKYIVPNANAQFDFLTKLRMVDIYSNIYGNFFVLVDWDVRKNGYVGPDMWLLNIRDVFPQVGAVSVEDSDYIIIRTWKPLSYFENLKKTDGFKNVPKILAKLKDKSGSKDAKDKSKASSKREENQYPEEIAAKEAGYFEVFSQFEGDRWVDFCVDADLEFRDKKNPHKNGEIPVVCKYSIPLLDDFMGMGDFERGKSMQMTVNSNWNLYLDAVKMSIFPPVIINKDNIAAASSFTMTPAAKWLARGQITNVAQPIQLNPQGISTFNNTYQVANSAILNLFGTTDTAVTAQTEAGYGKTPEALKMQGARENTRDNADRFYMEQFLTKVMKKMINLIGKKQSSAITIRMFGEEIEELAKANPDAKENYDEETGELSINKETTGSTLWDYEIVSGSTYAVDQQTQQQNLASLLDLFSKAQAPDGRNWIEERMKEEGYNFKFGELFKRSITNSGIQDWDKIIEEMSEEEKVEMTLMKDGQKFMQIFQQLQGVNQTPVPPEIQQAPQV